MTHDELQSKTISYLRFPLTLGIIFIHFDLIEHVFTYHGVQYGLDRPLWYVFIINFFSEVLPQIGVPLFFIISGYLFFHGVDFNGNVWQQKLRKRARTLLVPYLLWNLVAILIHAFYLIPGLFPNAGQEQICITPLRLFHTFFANFPNQGIFVMPADSAVTVGGFPYPVNLPMWYVRDLMVMVLLSPVVFWLIQRLGKYIVILLGIVYFFYHPLFEPDGSWGVLMSQAAFFFSWGAYYAIRKEAFVERFRRYPYMPLLYLPVAMADSLTRGAGYNLYIHQAGVLLGVVSAVVIVAGLLEKGRVHVNATLAGSSFFVYALHTSIMFEVSKVVFILFRLGDNLWSMLILYFATPVFTAAICVVLYLLLKRYIPSLCNLLTGGR